MTPHSSTPFQRLQSLKLTALTGLCAAVSAALGFAFIALPNLELLTVSIFLSGYLLGPWRGALVGMIAEFIYTSLNPMGMSFLPMMAAQIICMAVAGTTGGFYRALSTARPLWLRMTAFGAAGFLLTLNYQILVNASFYFFSLWEIEEAFIPYLLAGLAFSILHIVGNTLIFAIAAAPAAPGLKILLGRMLPASAVLCFLFLPSTASPQTSSDSLSPSVWNKTYYQDAADIFRLIPGFYHYDLALPGQPEYLFCRQAQPEVTVFGLPQNSALTGSYDFLQLSPRYYQSIEFHRGFDGGVISSPGVISLIPERNEPDRPYSRVDYRDGYYGFGAADFIFAQRVAQEITLQAGGRVSEFNGRYPNSKQHGEKFHGALFWNKPDGWKYRFIYLSHRNRAEITHTYDRRLLARQDLFITAENSWENPLYIAAQFYTMEDDYYQKPDALEQGYQIKLSQKRLWGETKIEPSFLLNWYSVHLSGFAENQAAATAAVQTNKQLSPALSNSSALSLEANRDFLLNGASSFQYRWSNTISTALTAARSQKSPAPLYRVYNLNSSQYFLPYSPMWTLPPSSDIDPNYDLVPETVKSLDLTGSFEWNEILRFKSGVFYQNWQNRIGLQPLLSGPWQWVNLNDEQLTGAETGIEFGVWKGFAGRMNWTYQKPETMSNFVPRHWGFITASWNRQFYQGDLDFTVEIHGAYIGPRSGVIEGNIYTMSDDNVWGVMFFYKIGDFTLFWGNENIFSRQYELVPGYMMIHREEVWGVNWVFWE